MGPERLGRARTVESIPAATASGRSPWAGAAPVRYPPRAAGLAAGVAVGLPGAPAGGHGELLFPTVDAAGRSVGVGWRNRPCVAGIGIVPAGGHHAWTGLQRRLLCAGRTQLVERGADPAAGKQPRHGSSYRGRDPVLAASGDTTEPPRRPSASTTSPPSTGSMYARPTPSRARSPRFVCAPTGPRAACRARRRWPWSSNYASALRENGENSMDRTISPRSFAASNS